MWAESPAIAAWVSRMAGWAFQQLPMPSDGMIPLGETCSVKWVDDPDGPLGCYDVQKNHVQLNVKLLDLKPELVKPEVAKTIFHEVWHGFESKRGWLCDDGAAECTAERLLVKWTAHEAELEAQAAAEEARAAELAAKAYQRAFPDSGDGAPSAPYDMHAHLRLPRPKEQRARYSYELMDAKYQSGMWQPSSTVGEASYRRLSEFSHSLYALLQRLNPTGSWDTGAYDRLAATYGNEIGREAGGVISPSYTRATAISFGIPDLWSRFDAVVALEQQMGDQLAVWRGTSGVLAAPTSEQLAKLMPPRPAPVPRGET